MKKSGMNIKMDNDKLILIIIFVVVIVFIFGMKPMYKTFEKLRNGTLFNSASDTPIVEPVPEEQYTILKPVGASNVLCERIISDEGGDKTIKTYLYYTNRKIKSIKEDISYSGITDEYTNYILSEQSKYKQRKNSNLESKGYSVEIDLVSTSTLKVSSVYLLEKIDLTDIVLKTDDSLEVLGQLDQDVYDLAGEYISAGYDCEW